jgi:serine/threonine protein kinase
MSRNPHFYNPSRNQWYFATSLLGQGGQGVVWGGTYGALQVAIKVQTDFNAWNREWNIHWKCFGHPFIISVFDQFVQPDGAHVLVMERADCSAQQLVDRGTKFTPMQICRIGADLASALEAIHAKGIRHRDITLKNVLRFADGKFKLGDFGIARQDMAADDLAMTQVGTPGWFPPEVLRGNGSTPSSDIYQLGLVLLSLLLGRQVIPVCYTTQQKIKAIIDGVPRQTAEQAKATHGEVAWIIRNMLPRTPGLRHATATSVRLAFEAEYRKLEAQTNVANTLLSRAPAATGLADLYAQFLRQPPASAMARQGLKPPPRNALAAALSRDASPSPARKGLLDLPPNPGIPPRQQALRRDVNQNPILSKILASPPKLGLINREMARPAIPNPARRGLVLDRPDLEHLPQHGAVAREPNQSAAVGGLLGLGALAALAAGEKPLAGALGIGALAVLASDPNAKSFV